MHNVSVKYGENPPVLKEINLTIRGGEKVGYYLSPNNSGSNTFDNTIVPIQ